MLGAYATGQATPVLGAAMGGVGVSGFLVSLLRGGKSQVFKLASGGLLVFGGCWNLLSVFAQ